MTQLQKLATLATVSLASLAFATMPVKATPVFSLAFNTGECATPGSPIAICGGGGSGGSNTPILTTPSVSLGSSDFYTSGFQLGPLTFEGDAFIIGALTLIFMLGDTAVEVLVENGSFTGVTEIFSAPVHILANSVATGKLYADGAALAGFNFSGFGFGEMLANISLAVTSDPAAMAPEPITVPEPNSLDLVLLALVGLGLGWLSRQETRRTPLRWSTMP